MRLRALPLALSVALGLLVAPAVAGADPTAGPATDAARERARAREAYDRGAAAHQRGDHATEARELARADAILPNAVTLQAALDAAVEADDPVLGITLCDRAQRAPLEGSLAAVVQRARARFGGRVGRVRVDCEGTSACAVTLDGSAVDAGLAIVVPVGSHVVSVTRAGQVEQRTLEVEPDGTAHPVFTERGGAHAMDLPPLAPTAAAPAPGPSPAWFVAALGATVIAAGVTVGLALDTSSQHAGFVAAGCPGPAHADCSALASDGLAAQLRTNALIGVTAALGAATVVAGVLTFRVRGAAGVERASLSFGAGRSAMLRVPLP